MGFSLMEAVIALALLALFAALAFPRIKGSNRIDLSALTVKLAAELRASRSLAISKNIDTRVTIDAANGAISDAHDSTLSRLPPSVKVFFHAAYAGKSPSVSAIWFFPDGSSSGGSLLLHSTNQKSSIDIDWLSGAVHIKTHDDD